MTRMNQLMVFSTALIGLALAVPCIAQTSTPSGERTLEEIVVTAQKQNERLLDVPVAVTSISTEALTDQNLIKMSDFYNRMPGLQYAGGNEGRVTNLAIRGITTGGGFNAPTVAILIDDVPFGGTVGVGQPVIPDFDPGTMQRIEMLRGPQGTLYGAASLGGLIKYVTRAPSTEDFSGRIELESNTVDDGASGWTARGLVNIPLMNERIGLSLSGVYRLDPAYVDNIFPTARADDVNERETVGGRAALLWQPTDSMTVTLSALAQRLDTRNTDLSPTYGIRVCPACQGPGNRTVVDFTPLFDDLTTISLVPSEGESEYKLYTARVELDLQWAQLTSISAYGTSDNVVNNDVTSVFGGLLVPAYAASAGSTVSISNANYTDKFSQELRLGAQGERFDWLAGVFYVSEESSTDQTLFLADPSGNPLATPYNGTGPTDYKESALFANVTWHATDKLDLQIGGRYAKNDQDGTSSLTIDGPAQPIFGPSTVVQGSSDEDAFTYLLATTYHFTPDAMAYVRVASGYRPGGFNTGVPNVAVTYDSDSVVNYEVGFKSNLAPAQLSVDVALFQIDWEDVQLPETDSVSQLTFNTNGGKARSRGVELAARWSPWQRFTVDGSVTYTDAEITEDFPQLSGASGLEGNSGDKLPFSAKWTGTISAQQGFSISSRLSGYVGASYAYVGERFSAFKTDAANATRPRFSLPDYSLIDVRVGLDLDDVWHLNVYARNLSNEFGVVSATTRNGTAAPTAIFTQPRTYGVSLARQF
jgi:iron complex outermembrane receptor protein